MKNKKTDTDNSTPVTVEPTVEPRAESTVNTEHETPGKDLKGPQDLTAVEKSLKLKASANEDIMADLSYTIGDGDNERTYTFTVPIRHLTAPDSRATFTHVISTPIFVDADGDTISYSSEEDTEGLTEGQVMELDGKIDERAVLVYQGFKLMPSGRPKVPGVALPDEVKTILVANLPKDQRELYASGRGYLNMGKDGTYKVSKHSAKALAEMAEFAALNADVAPEVEVEAEA